MEQATTNTTTSQRAAPRCPTCGGPGRQRSDEQHGLFFAVIAQAFNCWPEQHPFQPTTEDHLRGWLLIEAGHSVSVNIDGPKNITVRTVSIMRAMLRGLDVASETALVAMRMFETRTGIRITVPKSIKHRILGKRDFEKVSDAVYDLIEAATGTTVEEFKAQAKRGTA